MRIGFDFDNTIVSYDALFHKVAQELGVVHKDIPVNKIAVRDYLRRTNKEDVWTEMQGYVYGARMHEAQIFPRVLEVMARVKKAGHALAIISHKTKYPYLGEKYDLHASARKWIAANLCEPNAANVKDIALIPDKQIFFEVTKEQKLARIADFNCDVFMDDLPEILLAAQFPTQTQRFLFDPEQHYHAKDLPKIKIVSTWTAFESYLL